jgi:hypothetical protein
VALAASPPEDSGAHRAVADSLRAAGPEYTAGEGALAKIPTGVDRRACGCADGLLNAGGPAPNREGGDQGQET